MSSNPPDGLRKGPLISDWFRMDANGTLTAMTGRVELGQGNRTALLKMVADELGTRPNDIAIETARTDRTVDEGFTAGSLSVSEGGMALRWAASALRHLLLNAAATKLGTEGNELDIADSMITRGGVPTDLTFAKLATELNFDVPVEELASPRPPRMRCRESRDIGRIDLRERIVGAPFIHDMTAPDMLFGSPVHPPTLSARLVSLDVDSLKARPDIVDVVVDGSFVGVLAKSPYEAARAARAVRRIAEWSEAAGLTDDAMDVILGSEEALETVFETGVAESGTNRRFEAAVSRPYLCHASIAPSAAVAVWDSGVVTVWTHSQGVFPLRRAMAMALRMEEENIVVIHQPGAGCYGHNGADDAAFDAVLMARAVPGRHVKVVWSRSDEFQAAPLGPGMATTIAATVSSHGRITSVDVVVNSAPHAGRPGVNGTPNLRSASYLSEPILPAPSGDVPLVRGGGADRNAVPGYNVPNMRVRKRIVRSLPYRTSSLRSLGAFTNVFAIETLIDDMAAEFGADPIEFRLRHLDDPRSCEVIERLAQMTATERMQTLPDGCGWGLGFARYKNTSGYCAVMACVTCTDEVRVRQVRCVADIGEIISPDGARNQIEGGIVQATSWATKEAAEFEGARVLAAGWMDYPILRFSEVPQVKVELIERPKEPPLGCGEIAQGPTVAAIGNAVMAGLGIRLRDLPITRSAVVKAISQLPDGQARF